MKSLRIWLMCYPIGYAVIFFITGVVGLNLLFPGPHAPLICLNVFTMLFLIFAMKFLTSPSDDWLYKVATGHNIELFVREEDGQTLYRIYVSGHLAEEFIISDFCGIIGASINSPNNMIVLNKLQRVVTFAHGKDAVTVVERLSLLENEINCSFFSQAPIGYGLEHSFHVNLLSDAMCIKEQLYGSAKNKGLVL